MKHTPGPWTFEPEKLYDGLHHFAGGGPKVWFGPEPGYFVRHITVHGGEDNPAAEANARLIAAAPDLFKALELIRVYCQTASASGHAELESELDPIISECNKALARVKGE